MVGNKQNKDKAAIRRPKWTLAHKARNVQFSTGFEQFSIIFSNAGLNQVPGWSIWPWWFCVAVCEGGSRQNNGRKMEAPPGSKLIETEGRKLVNSWISLQTKSWKQMLGSLARTLSIYIERERERDFIRAYRI